MNHSICERCFHYAACSSVDITGSVGNPECKPENDNCEHFIDVDKVKIQDKASWVLDIKKWADGDVSLTYRCSHCFELEQVKMFKKTEWENYYHEHYMDGIELSKFCRGCGSVIDGITTDSNN